MSAKRDRIREQQREQTSVARRTQPPAIQHKIGLMKPGHHSNVALRATNR